MHPLHLILSAGCGDRCELWLGKRQRCRDRIVLAHNPNPICPLWLGSVSLTWALFAGRLGRLLPGLAVQPHRHHLRIALSIQRQQPGQHVIPHGIGPAIVPGEFAADGDDVVGLKLTLEIEGIAGISEEQIAAIDALLQVFGELDVFL